MINLKPEDLTEWDGFDVYDAETGEWMCSSDIAKKEFPEDRRLPQVVDGFCLTWDGFLCLTCEDGRTVYVQRLGKYLIQIDGGKYMRW